MKSEKNKNTEKKITPKRIAIIGFGPAGMACAMQLSRYNLKPIIFEKNTSYEDSLIKQANCIENYLGIYPPLSGEDLLNNFRMHLKNIAIKKIAKKIEYLDFIPSKEVFCLKTANNIHTADYLVLASGTKPKKISILENVNQSLKKYVLFEALPLLKEKNKCIAIIGAGDAAFDFALNLHKKGHEIHIINRSEKIKALPSLKEKIFAKKNIYYHDNTTLKKINSGKKTHLNCIFSQRKNNIEINCDYLIAALGRLPNKDFCSERMLSFEKKLINKNKLFLAGDVKNSIYRQIAIATADGIQVAMKIHEKIICLE